MRRSLFPIAVLVLVAGCSAPRLAAPSLAPRAAEAIDPRVQPTADLGPARPVDPALAEQLTSLVAQAMNGDAAFEAAAERAEALVAAAGSAQSESWIAAQQALSQAVAARGPTTRALGDADALAAETIAGKGGIAPADFAAIRSAADTIADIDRRQATRIDALRTRLRS